MAMMTQPLSFGTRIKQAIGKVWQWRRERYGVASEVASQEPSDLRALAEDFRHSGSELRATSAQWPASADLLDKRLHALELDPQKLALPGLLPHLQRCCAMCDSKVECANDLKAQPNASAWEQYCPNEPTLAALSALKKT